MKSWQHQYYTCSIISNNKCLFQIYSEICESITEDENMEIETDTCSIVVKKYLLDEENEYKCTIYGEDNDEDESTSTSVSRIFLVLLKLELFK